MTFTLQSKESSFPEILPYILRCAQWRRIVAAKKSCEIMQLSQYFDQWENLIYFTIISTNKYQWSKYEIKRNLETKENWYYVSNVIICFDCKNVDKTFLHHCFTATTIWLISGKDIPKTWNVQKKYRICSFENYALKHHIPAMYLLQLFSRVKLFLPMDFR